MKMLLTGREFGNGAATPAQYWDLHRELPA
jgi:hypothetical protein